jgi:hypothetical protein
MRHPELEQLANDPLGVILFRIERRAEVEVFIEKLLGAASFFFYLGAERGQSARAGAYIFGFPMPSILICFCRLPIKSPTMRSRSASPVPKLQFLATLG